jgi:subtilisin-like proprotein convertase family protein/uncharacterized protein YvpB
MGKQKKAYTLFGSAILIFLIYTLAFNTAAAQSDTEFIPESTQIPGSEYYYNFPLIFRQPTPTPIPPPAGELPKTLFCSSPSVSIPDNNQGGISNTITITDPRFIRDLDIRLDIDHSWVGDLHITLTHAETGRSIQLIDRPGSTPGGDNDGCSLDNIKTILDDDISLPVENECSSFPAAVAVNDYIQAAIAGTYIPEQALANFDAEPIYGNWILKVSDQNPFDTGKFNQWCIATELIETQVIDPPSPPPNDLPKNAFIPGVTGKSQTLPLDCESRSAVDWANYYGVRIDELNFFYGLPESDNPDLGFVGNVYGTWGQIPPYAYGVHADPIAKRLRHFGLSAVVHHPLSWVSLKAEIAAGRPVIVWILGSKYAGYEYVVNGIPEYYRPKEGNNAVVARYEHTVIVTGYTEDSVSYLNGGNIYQKDRKQFLESWSALGNMAITMQP